jgi:hypothetical protein
MTPLAALLFVLAAPAAPVAPVPATTPPTITVPAFSLLAPRPCPLVEAEAAGWREAVAALRTEQADTAGLPSARAARLPLYTALAVAHDHACHATAPDATELAAARSALAGEGEPALKDALRGLLALAFERAGVVDAARPFWLELRAAERPSDWLVRAWLAGGDTQTGGELEFSATQLYERAMATGGPPARCYAAFRLAENARRAGAEPATLDAAAARARAAIAAAPGDAVCAWANREMDRTPPPAYRAP